MINATKSPSTALAKSSPRKRTLHALFRDTRGATFVEYIVLVALVALGGIAAWKTFGGSIKTATEAQGTEITTQAVPGE